MENNEISINELKEVMETAKKQLGQQLEQYYTPTDNLDTLLQKDDIASKVSSIQANVCLLSFYNDKKNEGITQIIIDNKAYPLEAILPPELLELAQQPDFSLNNPETMESIIEYSIDNRNDDQLSSIKTRPQTVSPAQETNNAQDLNQKTESLLQNIPLGNNKNIDIASYNDQIEPLSAEDARKQAEKMIQKIQNQLNNPSKETDEKHFSYTHSNIGDLNFFDAYAVHDTKPNYDLTFDKPKEQLQRKDIEFEDMPDALAYTRDGKIYMKTMEQTPQETGANQQEPSNTFNLDNEYKKGNQLAYEIVALHEACHKTHENRVSPQHTLNLPVNTLKLNTLGEKTAYAVEYLAVANMYTTLKKDGITTISYKDAEGLKEIPIEKLLDFYPGLKEAVKDGFSPENPKDVRKLVEIASKNWDERMSNTYKGQAYRAADGVRKRTPSFSAQLKALDYIDDPEKKYEKDKQAMLTDVYIGRNTSVDLTHCADLLDTGNPEEILNIGKDNEFPHAKEILNATIEDKKAQMMPKELLLKLNDFLEQKGITTDQEKDDYIQKAFTAIVTRAPDAEQYEEFKNLLLENGGTINYTDGLCEIHTKDSNIIAYQLPNSKNYTINLPANDNSMSQTNEQATAREREETKKDMKKAREDHDEEVREQTEELTHLTLQTQSAENESTSAENNVEKPSVKTQINPILLKRIQNSRA